MNALILRAAGRGRPRVKPQADTPAARAHDDIDAAPSRPLAQPRGTSMNDLIIAARRDHTHDDVQVPGEPVGLALLGARLGLHDIRDVEGFAARLLDAHLSRTRGYLNPVEREDALTFLVEAVWELSRKWSPDRGIPSFSAFAWRRGGFAIINWYRSRFGRIYGKPSDAQRQNIAFALSLDAPAGDGAEFDSLGDAIAARPDDRPDDSVAGLAGIFGDGGGARAFRAEIERHQLAERSSR